MSPPSVVRSVRHGGGDRPTTVVGRGAGRRRPVAHRRAGGGPPTTVGRRVEGRHRRRHGVPQGTRTGHRLRDRAVRAARPGRARPCAPSDRERCGRVPAAPARRRTGARGAAPTAMTCSSGCPAWRASTRSSRSISPDTSTSCSPWAWPTCGRPACSSGSTTPWRRRPLRRPSRRPALARLDRAPQPLRRLVRSSRRCRRAEPPSTTTTSTAGTSSSTPRRSPLLRLGGCRRQPPLRQRARAPFGGSLAAGRPRRDARRAPDPGRLPRAVRRARLGRRTPRGRRRRLRGRQGRPDRWCGGEPSRRCHRTPTIRTTSGVRPSPGSWSSSTARSSPRSLVLSDRDGRRVVGMAEPPETKSIIVTQAVQDYAVAHSSAPPGRGAALADRGDPRARRHLEDADLPGPGGVHDPAHPPGRRHVRRRGRHLHRVLVDLHRPRPVRRWPAPVLRRQRGVDRGGQGALGAGRRRRSHRAADRAGGRDAGGAPVRSAHRPGVHRRRQARLRHLLRRDRRAAAPERCGAARQRPVERQRRRRVRREREHGGHPGHQRPRGVRPPCRGRHAPHRRRPHHRPKALNGPTSVHEYVRMPNVLVHRRRGSSRLAPATHHALALAAASTRPASPARSSSWVGHP